MTLEYLVGEKQKILLARNVVGEFRTKGHIVLYVQLSFWDSLGVRGKAAIANGLSWPRQADSASRAKTVSVFEAREGEGLCVATRTPFAPLLSSCCQPGFRGSGCPTLRLWVTLAPAAPPPASDATRLDITTVLVPCTWCTILTYRTWALDFVFLLGSWLRMDKQQANPSPVS